MNDKFEQIVGNYLATVIDEHDGSLEESLIYIDNMQDIMAVAKVRLKSLINAIDVEIPEDQKVVAIDD